jgi:hypothetical protein
MASITLKKLPDTLHRDVKRYQLSLEEKGVKKSLEDIYLEFIDRGLQSIKKADK